MNYKIVGACLQAYKDKETTKQNKYDRFVYDQLIPSKIWYVSNNDWDTVDITNMLVINNGEFQTVPYEIIDSSTVKLVFAELTSGTAIFIYVKS